MSTYAQLEDYAAWSGTPIVPDQASEIQFLLNEAEVELEVIAGDLGERITAELTTAERVTLAVVGMVGRVVRDQAEAWAMLADQEGAQEARKAMCRWLTVGRRERYLVGMFSSAGSLDLSTRDPQLVQPLVSPALDSDRWLTN